MPGKIKNAISSTILKPFYSAFATVGHHRVARHAIHAVKLPAPVISVGNIAFGGTAKTPTVEYLARLFSRQGIKPGVVLRGYKGSIDRGNLPPEIVSDGIKVLLDWKDSGDEASLLADTLLMDGIPVAVGRDRIGGSKILIDKYSAGIIILDDGFQFTRLKRDVDLALIDALAPFGRTDNGYGPLREPVSTLDRADAILLTHSESVPINRIEKIIDRLEHTVRSLPPVFTARIMVRDIRNAKTGKFDSPESLHGSRALAFAGIGNPLSFDKTIKSIGCGPSELIEFPDHHPYTQKDIALVNRRAKSKGAEIVLTTSKDAIRLNGLADRINLPFYVVEIELTIDDENEFFRMISKSLCGNSQTASIPVPAFTK